MGCLGSACLLSEATAAEKLDVENWLRRRGVRLLAVEFYATWCKPCMDTVPRWKALHEKYREAGLRLVVVSTQDPGGQCRTVGWNPDKVVCDLDGSIARSFGVGGALPSAFLWSWQGNLLVRRGHVDAVETAAKHYLGRSPRVLIEASGTDGRPAPDLAAALTREFSMTRKLVVVVHERERRRLRELRKATHANAAAANQRCRLGVELTANARLRARLLRDGAGTKLALNLQSIEKGCQNSAAFATYNPTDSAASVRETVASLLDVLRQRVEMPAAPPPDAARAAVVESARGKAASWKADATIDKEVVAFSSEPPGALVLVDGEMACRATPCSRALPPGQHDVSMQREDHVTVTAKVALAEDKPVRWKLQRNEAWLGVTTVPKGLRVLLDGKPAGPAPVDLTRVLPGKHKVEVISACHELRQVSVALVAGERKRLRLTPTPRMAGVAVEARDSRGNDLIAMVRVDGKDVGRTPRVFTVPMCSQRLEVEHDQVGSKSLTLRLEERKTTKYAVQFSGIGSLGEGFAEVTRPADWRHIAGWVGLGLGGALAVGGLVVSLGAQSDFADLEAALTDSSGDGRVDGITRVEAEARREDARSMQTLGGALIGVGAAAGAFGAWSLFTAAPGGDASALTVVPAARGLSARWEF